MSLVMEVDGAQVNVRLFWFGVLKNPDLTRRRFRRVLSRLLWREDDFLLGAWTR
jgi:hypothetical protein